MKPKTNGHERREKRKPYTPLLWINSEARKEREAKMINKRNRYIFASAMSVLYMVISLTITTMTDNEPVIVVFTFGIAWVAGWRSRIILQW